MSENRAPVAAPGGKVFSDEAVGGAPWLLVSKFLLFFVYMGISILTVRGLGKEAYGVFSICKNIVEYLVVPACLGLNAAILRFVPELTRHRNQAGLRRFLLRAALAQVLAALVIGVALVSAAPLTASWLGPSVAAALPWCALLLPALVGKDFFNDSMTALFQSRRVALLSLAQGGLWLAMTGYVLWIGAGVPGVLLAQSLSIFLVSAVAVVLLWRHVNRLGWRSPPQGIGRQRVVRMAVPVMLNGAARSLMMKYTEVFFLGAFAGAGAAGIYELGYTVPHLVITFIPMAVQTLLAAAFNQTYSRDSGSLPGLIDTTYKLLISLSIPLAAFGVFFSPRGVELIYGAEMRAAGAVASAFCVLHLLPLISMPLSMAIAAREKIHRTLHLMLLQVVTNIGLDLLLIPRFGIPGAIAAVALTFLITIPLRLANVRKLIGGIHFPAAFLLRLALPCAAVAGLLRWLLPQPSLFLLVLIAFLYLAVVVLMIRFLGILPSADVRMLGGLLPGRASFLFHRIFIQPDQPS